MPDTIKRPVRVRSDCGYWDLEDADGEFIVSMLGESGARIVASALNDSDALTEFTALLAAVPQFAALVTESITAKALAALALAGLVGKSAKGER